MILIILPSNEFEYLPPSHDPGFLTQEELSGEKEVYILVPGSAISRGNDCNTTRKYAKEAKAR
jgi:hypothetical protein